MNNIMPCPFCGHKVKQSTGFMGMRFFKCQNSKCGAIMSFDNDCCNRHPEKTIEIYNRRVDRNG